MKTLSSQIVYQNRWMSVREDAITLLDGSPSVYGVVEKDDFAVVIAMENNRIFLVRQYRYPVGEAYLEFPQGSCPDNPELTPEAVALRELKEETGLTAGSIRQLGTLYEAYGFCTQQMHIFLASDLTQGEQELEPEEHGMTVSSVSRSELEQMLAQGTIKDAATLAAYALFLLDERNAAR